MSIPVINSFTSMLKSRADLNKDGKLDYKDIEVVASRARATLVAEDVAYPWPTLCVVALVCAVAGFFLGRLL
jgi:hypothetical protein